MLRHGSTIAELVTVPPQPFLPGHHCRIEFNPDFPPAGSYLCAMQTPDGLLLAFTRRAAGGTFRLDAFGGGGPRYYRAADVEMVGRVYVEPRAAERGAA